MTTPHLESGVYYIQNIGTGTVLDLSNGSSANGTKVCGHTKRALDDFWAPAQLWIISRSQDGPIYTIENTNSRTFLDIPDNSKADGASLVGQTQTTFASQRWIFAFNASKNAYVIKNAATSTFIDLYNGGSADGTAVYGWGGTGATTENPHQLWKVIRA